MDLNKYLPLTETTFYIMLTLKNECHGYLIMQKVDKLSEGRVNIAAGTMYGAIEKLLKHELIQLVEFNEKRRKIYKLTNKGHKLINLEIARLKHLVNISKDFNTIL